MTINTEEEYQAALNKMVRLADALEAYEMKTQKYPEHIPLTDQQVTDPWTPRAEDLMNRIENGNLIGVDVDSCEYFWSANAEEQVGMMLRDLLR